MLNQHATIALPTASAVLACALLALAILGIAVAGLRVASTVAPCGLERGLTAVVVGVSIIVVETLVLGLVGLGSNRLALAAAAALTCVLAVRVLPAPERRPLTELSLWWRGLGPSWRVFGGALAGMVTAWAIWQLLHPAIGFDSATYHYVDVSGWVHNGRPGSTLSISYDFPYGNYPLTDEVALTWAAGISRSFVPLALWNPALLVLLAAGSWQTLRNLHVSRRAAGLATVALVTLPLIVKELNEPQTDLPALAWLACVAALATGAHRRPALLAPAVLAAGLAVGTRPTPVVMVVASLGVGFYVARASLGLIARRLAISLAGAIAVGGIWYLRNLVEHGSPLWPFSAAPWGDPTPRFLQLVGTRFIERPAATLRQTWASYGGQLGGGGVLLGGALVVFLVALLGVRLRRSQRRRLLFAAGVALVGLLAWSFAPGTGLPTAPQILAPVAYPISTLRYMLPALGAATVAVALASSTGSVTGAAATVALAATVAWNLTKDAELGFPFVPPARTVILGGAVGVALLGVVVVARPRARRWEWPRRAVPAAAVVTLAAVLAGVALALAGDGFVSRYARVTQSSPTRVGQQGVLAWLTARPGFNSSRITIAFASRVMLGPLAGDHFTHPLLLIPARASCEAVQALARQSVVVVTDPAYLQGLFTGLTSYRSGTCLAGRRPAYRDEFFAVYWPTLHR
jgi:hypothetical protein